MSDRHRQVNRESWDRWAEVHRDSEFYDLGGFRENPNSLNALEIEELGPVVGKSLLHLQCHLGVDTLSWQKRGARTVGVDFSETALEVGRSLSRELDIPSRFICCDVFDLRCHLSECFDIVFTSYGVIWWLEDLEAWARLIFDFLDPGGIFYIAEFHPLIFALGEDGVGLKYSYFKGDVVADTATGTYADEEADIETTTFGWQHSLGEVISALLSAGLVIEHFEEHPYSAYDCWPFTHEISPGRYAIAGREDQVPLMFSIRARKH